MAKQPFTRQGWRSTNRPYALAPINLVGPPEQPWKCPEDCAHYERSVIDATFADLARPPVEEEPDDTPDNIEGVLADAEAIVEHEEPEGLRELDEASAKTARSHWWGRRKRKPPDDEDFRLSNR